MSGHLTLNEYQLRDYRVKCSRCRRWMRRRPTVASPARRAAIPRASLCVDCLGTPSEDT
jgi:hypothetical protein